MAQFDPSTLYVGGIATYSHSKNADLTGDAEMSASASLVNISIGVFPLEKFLVGLNFGLLSSKESIENLADGSGSYFYDENIEKSSSYTMGPFVRYYIVKGLYGEASYFFGKSKTHTDYTYVNLQSQTIVSGWEENKQGVTGFSLGAGYSIFLTRSNRVALDVGVSYQNYKAASKFSGAGLGISGFLFKE